MDPSTVIIYTCSTGIMSVEPVSGTI